MSTQVDASTDEFLVQISADRSPRILILSVVGLIFLFAQGARLVTTVEAKLHTRPENWLYYVAIICLPVLGVLLFLWVVLQFSRPFFGSQQSLRATRAGLELASTDFGRTWQKRAFVKEEIDAISFGAVSVTRYGAVNGLKFNVHRKEIKALRRLKAVEAQRVLEELRRFGFDVVIDPAIRMVIEIEQARDRSVFG